MVVGHLENEEVFEDDVIHGASGFLLADETKNGNEGEIRGKAENLSGKQGSLCQISVQMRQGMSRKQQICPPFGNACLDQSQRCNHNGCMASLTFKSFPTRLHRELRAQASRHKRSMTKEAIALIEEGIARNSAPNVEALLERARRFRASLNFTVTDEDINRFKHEGRP